MQSYTQQLLALDAAYTARLRIAERPGWRRRLAILFAHSGDSWFWLLGLAVLFWAGPYFWRLRAAAMVVSILITALIVFTIKLLVRRKRPEGEWGTVYRKTDPHSFPSGHAARAAMLAVLALGLGLPWFGLLLALWAPLVVLARVAMGVHYLSDVIAGALLGIVVGLGLLALASRFTGLF
jgi:undecaprenyl-diphosphatase